MKRTFYCLVILLLIAAGSLLSAAAQPIIRNPATTNSTTAAILSGLGVTSALQYLSNNAVISASTNSGTLSGYDPVARLPVNTINKLLKGQPVNVLWLGDSLVNGAAYRTIQRGYFCTNLLSTWGTNGWWGGTTRNAVANDMNPWTVTGSTLGELENIGTDPASSPPWVEEYGAYVLTNGGSSLWSRGGSFFTNIDRAGLVYIKTNRADVGSMVVKIVSDSGVTNTLDTVALSATPRRTIGTNYSFSAGNYKILIESTGGSAFFAAPGIWSSTSPGIRYGHLGKGGWTDYSLVGDWVTAIAQYRPDLLLVHDANNNTYGPTVNAMVRNLQTNLPDMDVVMVGVHPSSADYAAVEQDKVVVANHLYQAFARTNKNTAYFDSMFALGNGRGWTTITNLGLADSIHPDGSNPTLSYILGKKLLEDLQLHKMGASSVGSAVVSDPNALTNSDTRAVHFNGFANGGQGLYPVVVNGAINTTGSAAGLTFTRRDNPALYSYLFARGNQIFKVGTSEQNNHANADFGLGGIVVSNVLGTIFWDIEDVGSNKWAGFTIGKAGRPDIWGSNIVAKSLFTGDGAGISNAVDLVAGSSITVTPDATKRSWTIAATGSGAASSSSGTLSNQVNTIYVDPESISYFYGSRTGPGSAPGSNSPTNHISGFTVNDNNGILYEYPVPWTTTNVTISAMFISTTNQEFTLSWQYVYYSPAGPVFSAVNTTNVQNISAGVGKVCSVSIPFPSTNAPKVAYGRMAYAKTNAAVNLYVQGPWKIQYQTTD